MDFKIERNVPVIKGRRKGQSKFPWKSMKIGDSFVVPDFRARNSAYSSCKGLGMDCTTHLQPDGSYRIWRTK